MTQLISEINLRRLRGVYSSGLMDACQLLSYNQPGGAYGYAHPEYEPGPVLQCLFRPADRSAELMGDAQVRNIDAICYLPRTATVDNKDRLKVISLHGEEPNEVTIYEVVAGPIFDSVVQKVGLQLVTDGSDVA